MPVAQLHSWWLIALWLYNCAEYTVSIPEMCTYSTVYNILPCCICIMFIYGLWPEIKLYYYYYYYYYLYTAYRYFHKPRHGPVAYSSIPAVWMSIGRQRDSLDKVDNETDQQRIRWLQHHRRCSEESFDDDVRGRRPEWHFRHTFHRTCDTPTGNRRSDLNP